MKVMSHFLSRANVYKLFFVCVTLLLVLVFYRPIAPWFNIHYPFEKIQSGLIIKNDRYDSHIPNSQPLIFNVAPDNGNWVTHISFDFKLSGFKDFMDFFQTAPYNSGIRLEISKQNQRLALLVKEDKALSGFFWVEFGPKLLLNEWHSFTMDIWGKRDIQIKLDDYPVSRFLNTKIANSIMDYQISQIIVGGGFSPERQLDGELNHFLLKNDYVDQVYHKRLIKIELFLSGLFFALLLWSGGYLLMTASPLSRKTKIEYLALTIMIGFFLAVAFHYIVANYYHGAYPKDTFILKVIGGHFGDFMVSLLTDYSLDPYHSQILRGEYFPFTYVLIYPFVWVSENTAVLVYSLFFLIGVYIFVSCYFGERGFGLTNRLSSIKNCFILSFMTYPVLFSFERANLENAMFILIAFSLYCYQNHRRLLTILFLAIASSFKMYPLLFIVLFVVDKRYWEAVGTLSLTAFLTVISLFILSPDWLENLKGIFGGINGLNNNCTAGVACIQYSVSIWAPVKFLYLRYGSYFLNVLNLAKAYQIISIVLVGLTVLLIIVFEKQYWRRLMLVVGAMLLLPIVSNAYKMLYVLLPLAAWVNASEKKDDAWYLILFALLLIPKNYVWLHLESIEISINEMLNTFILGIVMLSMMIQSVFHFWQRKIYEK